MKSTGEVFYLLIVLKTMSFITYTDEKWFEQVILFRYSIKASLMGCFLCDKLS